MYVGKDNAGHRVLAWEALKAVQYRCPDCDGQLVLKQGQHVGHHFAHHKRPTDCRIGRESLLHHVMKRYVYEQLNRIWPGSAQIEWPRGWGIADVWIRLPDGHGVAVECQVTHLDSNRITAKILNYAVSGDAVLFVVPWRCLTEYDDGSYKVPLWLRWLHGSYMGRLYLFGLEGVQVVNFLDDQWSKTFRSLRPGPMIDWKQLSWQWAGDRGPLGHLKFRIAHFQEGVFWRR